MIVKTRFGPVSMWPYARFELGLGATAGVAAWVLVDAAGLAAFALPGALANVLGTAVSILLAVRVNTAYQRWWEASAVWAQIVGLSRTLVRVAVAVSGSRSTADPAAVRAFQLDIATGQIAWTVALRTVLRSREDRPDHSEALSHLPAQDSAALREADNLPAVLLQRQSLRIFRAFRDGILVGLDNFQMEVALAGLAQQQALAERTRMQAVPAVYNVFSRYLVHMFVVVFPFAVIGSLTQHRWLVIPAATVVGFAFRMIERIGAVVENPYAGTAQDVPLTALTTAITRDLLELADVPERPAAPHPVGGYLD